MKRLIKRIKGKSRKDLALDPKELEKINQVKDIVNHSKRMLFITGAGLSADSQLPTYRGIGGLYNDQFTEEGIPIEEALSGHMLKQRPELTWGHISRIETACRGAQYNRGHEVIAEMETHFEAVWTLTQNVDGFHHKAGTRNLIDIHGTIHDLLCTVCDYKDRVNDYQHIEEIPPKCPSCGSLVRPNVVLFGEMLPMEKLETLYRQAAEGFDVIFTVGTSSGFPYIVEPILQAKRFGIPTVEINPGWTEVSNMVDYKIEDRAAPVLDALWRMVRKGG
jgi:NAD-dependent deacetylase